MAIPAILLAQYVTASLPILAVVIVWGRRPPAPHKGVALWFAFMIATGALDVVAARATGTNEWLGHLTLPIEVSLVLWYLSFWQPAERLRRTYRLAVPVVLLGAAIVLMTAGDPEIFDIWISPALALVVLAGLLQTLVHRSLISTESLGRQDWFWVCLGASVFWLGFVSLPPFHRAFVDTHPDWVRVAYMARAWVNIGAFLMVTWGVLCQRIPARSSGRS